METSRRDAMRLLAAAAAAGAGGTIATDSALADDDGDGIDWQRGAELALTVTNPKAAALLHGGRLANRAVDEILGSEDLTDGEIALHNQAVTAMEWWDATSIILENRLEDASMIASIRARDAIADAWEAGKEVGGGQQAAIEAIEDHYALIQRNELEVAIANWAQLGAVVNVQLEVDDISDNFVNWVVANDDYSGDGDLVADESNIMQETTEIEVDLLNGETYETEAPTFHVEWDNGDSAEFPLGQELIDAWDSDDEVFVMETEDGEEFEDRFTATVANVAEADLLAQEVGNLEEVMKLWDDIEDAAEESTQTYDLDIVEALYDAMDEGTLDPADVRGVEGIAEFLSGSTDATDSRYEMAMMSQMGLEHPNLADSASMTLSYTGFTHQTYSRNDEDGYVDGQLVHDRVEDEAIEGLLFGKLLGDTSLAAGQEYALNPVIPVRGGLLNINGETLLEVDDLGLPSLSPDGTTIVFEDSDEESTVAYDMDSDRVLWTHSTPFDGGSFSPDGEMVYRVHGGMDVGEMLDAETGDVLWTGSNDSTSNAARFSPDSEYLVESHGASGLVVYDAVSGDVQWSTEVYISGLSLSPDGEAIATGTHSNNDDGPGVYIFDLESGDRDLLETDEFVHDVEWTLDGVFTSWEDDGRVELIDPETGDAEWTLHEPDGEGDFQRLPDYRTVAHVSRNDDFDDDFRLLSPTGEVLHEAYDVLGGPEEETGDPWLRGPVDGIIQHGVAFDAVEGEEVNLARGLIEVEEMVDSDGNEVVPFVTDELVAELESEAGEDIETILEDVDGIDDAEDLETVSDVETILEDVDGIDDAEDLDSVETISWDEPQYDEVDTEEYRKYLEKVSEEYADALAEREEDDTSVPAPSNPLDDWDLGFLTNTIAGLPVWLWGVIGAGAAGVLGGD
ncbi:hypothetical protein GCM10010443_90610 [Actinoplanes cyaneus]